MSLLLLFPAGGPAPPPGTSERGGLYDNSPTGGRYTTHHRGGNIHTPQRGGTYDDNPTGGEVL